MTLFNPFEVAEGFAKKAEPLPLSATSQGYVDSAKARTAAIALLALSAGAGARGLSGLYNQAHRRISPPTTTYPSAMVAEVPYPVRGEDEEEKRALEDNSIQSLGDVWWYPAAATVAGMGGAYGGWKGMDAILDRRRRSEQEEEMAKSKSDFEQALLADNRVRPAPKLATEKTAAQDLSDQLDALYDQQEKQSQSPAANWATPIGSHYLAYAAAVGLPAALIGYQRARKSNEQAVLSEAMKKRMRNAYAQRPSEIYAVPGPAHVRDEKDPLTQVADESAEEAADPNALAAGIYGRD